MRRFACLLCVLGSFGIAAAHAAPVDVAALVKTIRAVGPDAAGHKAAADAWKLLSQADAGQLPAILAGLDGAEPLAANWLRAAVDTVAERAVKAKQQVPVAELETFLLDRGHAPRGRRLAFEWLARIDAAAPARIIPQMLNDPSLELRRDAVARLIEQAKPAEDKDRDQAVALYQQALTAARDLDQVKLLAERLEKLEVKVDLPRHFGFITHWKLIGPFDNTAMKAFRTAYPPESAVDPLAKHTGKSGEVKWIEHVTADKYGMVDLNKAIGPIQGSVAYCATEFVAEREQPIEIRFSTVNATRLWLNGQLLAEHEIYHASSGPDQYVAHGKLKAGKNHLLLKVCQNEQTEDWAKKWEFQLRVCDALGTAILSQDRPAAAK